MYSSIIKEFNNKLLSFQVENGIDDLMNLSPASLHKINVLATEKLTRNSSISLLNSINNLDFENRFKCFSFSAFLKLFFLFLILLVFHLLLLLAALYRKDRFLSNLPKTIFFGDHSYVTKNGYGEIITKIESAEFYSLIGIAAINKRGSYKNDKSFLGFAPNYSAFRKSLRFIFYFGSLIMRQKCISIFGFQNGLMFMFEYIKVFYSHEKAVLIESNIPDDSISIFMCDNNFFYTVLIDKLNKSGKNNAVLQHGSFLDGNLIYLPPLCKSVLACSEREANYFKRFIQDQVYVVGMPLQIATGLEEKLKRVNSEVTSFDILVLGRNGNLWEMELAYQVFSDVKLFFSDKKVILRHHPASNKWMRQLLEVKLPNSSISKGNNLEEDLAKAKIVISFSVDANLVALAAGKRVIFCGEPEAEGLDDFGSILENLRVAKTSEDLLDAINHFNSPSFIASENSDAKFVYTFGEYRYDLIVKNFETVLRDIN